MNTILLLTVSNSFMTRTGPIENHPGSDCHSRVLGLLGAVSERRVEVELPGRRCPHGGRRVPHL